MSQSDCSVQSWLEVTWIHHNEIHPTHAMSLLTDQPAVTAQIISN